MAGIREKKCIQWFGGETLKERDRLQDVAINGWIV
jgi:hypothetical protein